MMRHLGTETATRAVTHGHGRHRGRPHAAGRADPRSLSSRPVGAVAVPLRRGAAAPASGRPAMSGEPEHPAAVLQVERLHSRARLAGTTWWPVRARGEGLGGAFEITLAMPRPADPDRTRPRSLSPCSAWFRFATSMSNCR
jgi:hypothetical protein